MNNFDLLKLINNIDDKFLIEYLNNKIENKDCNEKSKKN